MHAMSDNCEMSKHGAALPPLPRAASALGSSAATRARMSGSLVTAEWMWQGTLPQIRLQPSSTEADLISLLSQGIRRYHGNVFGPRHHGACPTLAPPCASFPPTYLIPSAASAFAVS